jgi:FKBP-type peptidyl-prolyl cis-trans isomerase FkpA
MKKIILLSILTIFGLHHITFAQVKENKKVSKKNVNILQPIAKKKSNTYTKINNIIEYKIYSLGAGPLVKEGDFVRMHFVQLCGDSVLNSTYRDGKEPAINKMVKRDSPDDFSKATYKMRAGDSLVVRYNVDSVLKKNRPSYYKRGDELKFLMKIESILTKIQEDSLMGETDKMMEIDKKKKENDKQRFLKELEDLIPIENQKIEDYCKENNIVFQKTKSGLYYCITKNGSGNLVAFNDKVTVSYDAYFMNGEKFDSNIDSAFNFVKPFVFTAGEGKVIKGWDEGIQLLNLGAKAIFLIPSRLAYGEKGYKKIVPVLSVLRYEVEVTRIDLK